MRRLMMAIMATIAIAGMTRAQALPPIVQPMVVPAEGPSGGFICTAEYVTNYDGETSNDLDKVGRVFFSYFVPFPYSWSFAGAAFDCWMTMDEDGQQGGAMKPYKLLQSTYPPPAPGLITEPDIHVHGSFSADV